MYNTMNTVVSSGNSNSYKHDKKAIFLYKLNEERWAYIMSCLIDKEVVVNLENGSEIKGTFNSFDPGSRGTNRAVDIALNPNPASEDENLRTKPTIVYGNEYHFFTSRQISRNLFKQREHRPNSSRKPSYGKFKTDSEISSTKPIKVNSVLTEWRSTESVNESQLVELEKTQSEEWDQFETNNKEYGVVSTFDENLYTTSLNLSEIPDSVREKADQIATEIENNPETNFAQIESTLEDEDVANIEVKPPPKPQKESRKRDKNTSRSRSKTLSHEPPTEKMAEVVHPQETEKPEMERQQSSRSKHDKHFSHQIGVNALNIEPAHQRNDAFGSFTDRKQRHSVESEKQNKSFDKTERQERSERAERSEKSVERAEKMERDRPERLDKPELPSEKPERVVDSLERVDKFERPDKPIERADKYDRAEKIDRSDRLERHERYDRQDRFDRYERFERPERGDKLDRMERGDRFERHDRTDTRERSDLSPSFQRNEERTIMDTDSMRYTKQQGQYQPPKPPKSDSDHQKKSFKFNPNASSFTPGITTDKPATTRDHEFQTPTVTPKVTLPRRTEFRPFKQLSRFPRLDLREFRASNSSRFTDPGYEERWAGNGSVSYRDILGDLNPLHLQTMQMRPPHHVITHPQMPPVIFPMGPQLAYPPYTMGSLPVGMVHYGPQLHPRLYNGVQYAPVIPNHVMPRRNHMPANQHYPPMNMNMNMLYKQSQPQSMPKDQYLKSRSSDGFDDKQKGYGNNSKQIAKR
ncbi:LsmAD domain protein [Theileria parva strain Muguga]|uniref:LsmAD domain protein n=1 Tax=Theileria parva strain Muguga TaxID=333668 RepID=UPI001C622462|nr:LsmAD domain protein [Theileria parva strain Muguga]EAN32140.2 LsmAD domain protein [Theileria parva strain Muguga]